MQVIVFASSKGGVGKTTTALALASVLTHHGAATTLIDADPNAPLALWASRFSAGVPKQLTVKTAFRTDVAEVIDDATGPYVIVDLEGSRNDEVSVAIGRADLVLIPMKGNQLDADEASTIVTRFRESYRENGGDVPAAVETAMSTAGRAHEPWKIQDPCSSG